MRLMPFTPCSLSKVGVAIIVIATIASIVLIFLVALKYLCAEQATAIGELLLVAVLGIEGLVAFASYRHATLAAIIGQVAEHHMKVSTDPDQRSVVHSYLRACEKTTW